MARYSFDSPLSPPSFVGVMLVVGLVEEIRLAHFPPTPSSSAAVGSKIPGTKKRIGCSCRLGGVSLLSRTTGPLIQGVSQIASLGNKINCLRGGLYFFFRGQFGFFCLRAGIYPRHLGKTRLLFSMDIDGRSLSFAGRVRCVPDRSRCQALSVFGSFL